MLFLAHFLLLGSFFSRQTSLARIGNVFFVPNVLGGKILKKIGFMYFYSDLCFYTQVYQFRYFKIHALVFATLN